MHSNKNGHNDGDYREILAKSETGLFRQTIKKPITETSKYQKFVTVLFGPIFAFGIYNSKFWENEHLILLFKIVLSVLLLICFCMSVLGLIKYREGSKRAKRILLDLRNGKNCEPFVLFLRPFISDAKVYHKKELPDLTKSTKQRKKWVGEYDFEDTIKGLTPENSITIRVCAKNITADGRFLKFNDGEWKENVELLILESKFIFLIPASTEGTIWEVQRIFLHRLLEKTVIIMPPKLGEDFGIEEEWEKTRNIYRAIGWHLPKYDIDGAFIKLNANGNVITDIRALDYITDTTKLKLGLSSDTTADPCTRSLRIPR
jgi:hypothetical protein